MLVPLALLHLALLQLASALVVVSPASSTVWDANGQNVIQWARTSRDASAGSAHDRDPVLPLTNPLPASSLFDIFLRQGTGLYSPSLNISLASAVDSATHTSLSFPLTGQLKAGSGYQLFFSAPGRADIVYADSPSFSIANNTPSSSAQALPVSAASVATSKSQASPSPSGTSTAAPLAASSTGLVPAAAPGGLSGQGTNFVSCVGACSALVY